MQIVSAHGETQNALERVAFLETYMRAILHEPNESMSDAKCLREITRMARIAMKVQQ